MTRRCGFILNYKQSNEMFKTTCKRSARTARNVADQIDFIVSHVEDGCRFWIMVIDQQVKSGYYREKVGYYRGK